MRLRSVLFLNQQIQAIFGSIGPPSTDALLLETGVDFLLLETNDKLLLE
jgi:hypothetical protein